MKARMLCFLIASMTMSVIAAGPNFAALIEKAEVQSEHAHTEMLKSRTSSEAIGFYNTDWLSLRHKKRFAIAKAEVKLKKSQP